MLSHLIKSPIWAKGVILLIGIMSTFLRYIKSLKQMDEKLLLQRLSKLRELIEAGNSPSYSYHYLGEFDYPEFFIHPNDAAFRIQIFKKQLSLLEKKVLLKEELQADFSAVGYRLTLMQFLPLMIMFTLGGMFRVESYPLMDIVTALGLSVSFHISEGMKRGISL